LYINPHVTFYFRTEAHLVSEEGLNTYGAVTWGQFFIYQGFNGTCGWMQTSSYADVADVYAETIQQQGNNYRYLTGAGGKTGQPAAWKDVVHKQVSIHVKNGNNLTAKTFPVYFTHHGPVMGRQGKKWLALKEANRSLSALMQSWLRTKAGSLADFKKVMDMRSNNSNNTVFADNKGNIAYWHGNFLPRRNKNFDWTLPVDGSKAETEWGPLHTVEETVHLINPKSGFIQNCNSTPFTASGESSPRRESYPAYMAPEGRKRPRLKCYQVAERR
jgi:acyl-homoserine lactone acylase PvdQ